MAVIGQDAMFFHHIAAMSTHVAGVDGTPGGWAVIIMQAGRSVIQKVAALSSIIDGSTDFDIIAISAA
jgi:hypothetical protein